MIYKVAALCWLSEDCGRLVMPEEPKIVQSPCQVEALKRCLEEHKGDHSRCRKEVEAFSASCGAPKAQAGKTTS